MNQRNLLQLVRITRFIHLPAETSAVDRAEAGGTATRSLTFTHIKDRSLPAYSLDQSKPLLPLSSTTESVQNFAIPISNQFKLHSRPQSSLPLHQQHEACRRFLSNSRPRRCRRDDFPPNSVRRFRKQSFYEGRNLLRHRLAERQRLLEPIRP